MPEGRQQTEQYNAACSAAAGQSAADRGVTYCVYQTPAGEYWQRPGMPPQGRGLQVVASFLNGRQMESTR